MSQIYYEFAIISKNGSSNFQDFTVYWYFQVFHDCRMASDILSHQYKINLVNVFDTHGFPVYMCCYFQVFHDCRMASDILFHQYKINLVNVFDTQVSIPNIAGFILQLFCEFS